MEKKSALLIIALIATLVVTIIALALPEVGTAMHDFALNTVGPTVWGAITWAFTAPYLWGSANFIQGFALTCGIVLLLAIAWNFALKDAYTKLKGKVTGSQPEIQPQTTYKEPQTVYVKEVPVTTSEEKKS